MITEQDLQAAIAECQGERNPNANTCMKLAAFYTIRNELFGNRKQDAENSGYSFAALPQAEVEQVINLDSDTEFANAVNGQSVDYVLDVMDELMETLQVLHPRLYDGVMRRFGA